MGNNHQRAFELRVFGSLFSRWGNSPLNVRLSFLLAPPWLTSSKVFHWVAAAQVFAFLVLLPGTQLPLLVVRIKPAVLISVIQSSKDRAQHILSLPPSPYLPKQATTRFSEI